MWIPNTGTRSCLSPLHRLFVAVTTLYFCTECQRGPLCRSSLSLIKESNLRERPKFRNHGAVFMSTLRGLLASRRPSDVRSPPASTVGFELVDTRGIAMGFESIPRPTWARRRLPAYKRLSDRSSTGSNTVLRRQEKEWVS